MGAAGPAGEAAGARVALSRSDPADPELHQGTARVAAERRRERVHPGIRRRTLVGATAAQPAGIAAQGPAAVPAQRDGDERAVAARLVAGSLRSPPGAPR